MAVNPLATDDLTIDFKELMEIPVSQRVQAAETSSSFVDAILQAMTPFQIAQAFPSYYKKLLPDISNFITTNIERKLGSAGRGYDQTGGGAGGSAQPYYSGEGQLPYNVRPQTAVEESKLTKILQKAGVSGIPTGETGVTSAIKDERGYIISTADTSLLPEQRALLDTIAVGDPTRKANYWESPDYNTIVGRGGKFDSYADHPRVFGTATSTAAGRYQFTKTTWDGVVKEYNSKNPNSPITDFSPVNQDRAAMYLAEKDYRQRTGRDLTSDLLNPPENFGDLLTHGLGGRGNNTTWQIFQMKTSEDVASAYKANVARNQGYTQQEIEAQAKTDEQIKQQTTATPELMKTFEGDPETQKYFAEHPEVASKVQDAINAGKITLEDVSSIITAPTSMAGQGGRSPTSSDRPFAQGLDLETNRGLALSFLDNADRNPDGANLRDVDERLLEITEMGIKKFEAENPNLKVEIYGPSSGKRQSSVTTGSQHLLGKALDYEIFEIDPETGKKVRRLANFANQAGAGESADEYLRLHQNIELARIYKKDVLKDNRFSDVYGRSGALFGGSYALDTQHYDIGGAPGQGLESAAQPGGSIFGGYSEEYARRFGIQDTAAMNQDDILEMSKLAYGPRTELDSNVAEAEPTAQPQQTSTVPAPEEPTPQAMALGGFIPEKDNLSVMNAQGDVVAKINEGELQQGLTREGSGMRVESNKKRMAESLVDQNERSMYESDITEPAQETEQTNAGGFRQVQKPARITNDVMLKDQQWREAAASASYPIGSQIRAFKRSKFMQEGYHFNRATPGSHT